MGAAAAVEAYGKPVVYSMGPVVLAFSCAFLTGLVFGLMPARKAARLQRTAALALQRQDGDLEILNDGHLEDAGRQLLQRLVPRMP